MVNSIIIALLIGMFISLMQISCFLNKISKRDKLKVIFLDDSRHGDFKKGDKGYIDGYVIGGSSPCAVVVVDKNLVLVEPYRLEVIS